MACLPPACREAAGGGEGTEGQADLSCRHRMAARNEMCGAGKDELGYRASLTIGRARRRLKKAPNGSRVRLESGASERLPGDRRPRWVGQRTEMRRRMAVAG